MSVLSEKRSKGIYPDLIEFLISHTKLDAMKYIWVQ